MKIWFLLLDENCLLQILYIIFEAIQHVTEKEVGF